VYKASNLEDNLPDPSYVPHSTGVGIITPYIDSGGVICMDNIFGIPSFLNNNGLRGLDSELLSNNERNWFYQLYMASSFQLMFLANSGYKPIPAAFLHGYHEFKLEKEAIKEFQI